MQVRGRYLVVGWTAVFLAVAGVIVTRTRASFEVRKHLDDLNHNIAALEGTRADLLASLASLRSRAVLGPKVQALGLRFASDSELISIPLPTRRP